MFEYYRGMKEKCRDMQEYYRGMKEQFRVLVLQLEENRDMFEY